MKAFSKIITLLVAVALLAAKNDILADCLKKPELVDDACKRLLTDEVRELLDSTVCEKVGITWGSAPVESVKATMQPLDFVNNTRKNTEERKF